MTFSIPERDLCPFCSNLDGSAECVFIYRDEVVASFVNPFQLEHGGLLIIPVKHFTSLLNTPEDVVMSVYAHARKLASAVVDALNATGVNVFQNNGFLNSITGTGHSSFARYE